MKKSLFLKIALACALSLMMLLSLCAFAEEPVVEPAAELTEEQQAALDNLPEGFSRSVVAAEMARSTECTHTSFFVSEDVDDDSFVLESIDRETHTYTYKIISRHLYCSECDKLLQTIDVDITITESWWHCWYNDNTAAENIFECEACGATIQVHWPCEHKTLYVAEDGFGNAYCYICGAVVIFRNSQYTCDHSNYTVFYPDEFDIIYSPWDEKQHVEETYYYIEYDLSRGIAGLCNDCLTSLVCKPNGEIDYCVSTDDSIHFELERLTSVFEPHTFTDGICVCGEKQTASEGTKPTHYSIALNDSTVTLTPDEGVIELENPMLIVNWAYTLYDGTAFSYTRLIKADDLAALTYDLGLAEGPAGSKLESVTVIITDVSTLDITVAAKGYGFAQF